MTHRPSLFCFLRNMYFRILLFYFISVGRKPIDLLETGQNIKQSTLLFQNNCSLIMQCYCPKVGDHCETLLYIVNLNGLIQKLKNIGNHNRNYFFTIKVTNRAKLVNIEHMDVLVDDSPPETGVILEGK